MGTRQDVNEGTGTAVAFVPGACSLAWQVWLPGQEELAAEERSKRSSEQPRALAACGRWDTALSSGPRCAHGQQPGPDGGPSLGAVFLGREAASLCSGPSAVWPCSHHPTPVPPPPCQLPVSGLSGAALPDNGVLFPAPHSSATSESPPGRGPQGPSSDNSRLCVISVPPRLLRNSWQLTPSYPWSWVRHWSCDTSRGFLRSTPLWWPPQRLAGRARSAWVLAADTVPLWRPTGQLPNTGRGPGHGLPGGTEERRETLHLEGVAWTREDASLQRSSKDVPRPARAPRVHTNSSLPRASERARPPRRGHGVHLAVGGPSRCRHRGCQRPRWHICAFLFLLRSHLAWLPWAQK